jgi:hypothetical protein
LSTQDILVQTRLSYPEIHSMIIHQPISPGKNP